MGFFDDIGNKFKSAASDVGTYIAATAAQAAATPLMAVAEQQKGNLSAAEIANGARGATPATATAQAPAAALARAQDAGDQGMGLKQYLPLILIAGGAYFLFSRRGRA